MKLGLSTSFLRPASTRETVQLCEEAGIFTLELWDHDGFFAAGNAAELSSRLDAAGIRVLSLHAPFVPGASLPRLLLHEYSERFRSCCGKGRLYQAAYVVVHPLVLEGESPVPEELRESAPQSVRLWRELAAIAESEGLHLAYENIPAGEGWPAGCTWPTACKIAALAGGGNTGTCLDISHLFANGELPAVLPAIETGPLPLGIHVSDGVEGSSRDRHLPPGDGDMNWAAFLGLLARRRFSGILVIEVNSPYLSGYLVRDIARFLRANMK